MGAAEASVLATTAAYVLLALAALRLHLRQRTEASRWLLAAFGAVGGAVLAGSLVPDDAVGILPGLVGTASGMLLVLFPYALFRFAASFRPPDRRLRRAAAAAAATAVVALPVAVRPGAEEPSAAAAVYLPLVLLYWTALTVAVVVRLWRASRGQPRVARWRLRVLGVAAGLLNLALVASVTMPAASTGAQVGVQLAAIASSVLFLLGFSPPAVVRRSWRAPDEEALRRAERDLLLAEDVDGIARGLSPSLRGLFGGEAALVDRLGRSLAADGPSLDLGSLPAAAQGEVEATPDALVLGLADALLVVRATPFTPFFGAEEVGLLRTFAATLDLALARVALLEQERSARREAEATNAELEALLYGISHDLRTPLVALTGYVELLGDGAADREEAGFVLARITANTAYMDALITDLLELSRVGRIQEAAEPVALDDLAREIAAELVRRRPEARVEVSPLPIVQMEPVRARQLLTNLLGNALEHAGRRDVTVRVTAATEPAGTVVSVADDGVGIAPEHRQRIFGIFERLQGRGEERQGTGIGLAMCRRIVEQLGGRVWVADADTGTDVRFHLPASRVLGDRPSLEMSP